MIHGLAALLSAALSVAVVSGAGAAAGGGKRSQAVGQPDSAGSVVLKDALMIGAVGRSERSIVHSDPIEAQIVSGAWKPPSAGDPVKAPNGQLLTWTEAHAGDDGWITDRALEGGYVYFQVESAARKVMLLQAAGHNMVYVNGEPRIGDPYSTGWVRLPILLNDGSNELLFQVGRGRLRAEIRPPSADVQLDTADSTLPDLHADRPLKAMAAVVVINSGEKTLRGLTLTAQAGREVTTALPDIPPISVRKVGFRLSVPAQHSNSCRVRLVLKQRSGGGVRILSKEALILRVRRVGETYKETFISDIDGSVQYFAVNPAHPSPGTTARPALFLSLHGAGVEAIGQADAYSYKTWGDIVCPTNRRPYGFDWEDWGRMDALEVLARAREELRSDPSRIYLTGHSMGGHGAWQLGANYPALFASVGPSAGWISFQTYTNGGPRAEPTPTQEMLRRAAASSDTLALAPNFDASGVYVLHGAADDNVPVEEARTMFRLLSDRHDDVRYHEQPGAGHWWDASPEPGADCVDWAPMYDFFARHAVAAGSAVREVSFVTGSPGVSARSHWATMEAQVKQGEIAGVHLRYDPLLRSFSGTTDNVARLRLDVSHFIPGPDLSVSLDGQLMQKIPWPSAVGAITLSHTGTGWSLTGAADPGLKGPERYGCFKSAFNHRALLVYGTAGTPEENQWAFDRARYDAEAFWYRGNGSFDVAPDTAFDPEHDRDRSVILYGNADTNRVWAALLGDGPVKVSAGRVKIGAKVIRGPDLACLFLRPRPGSATASVAAVTGTGLAGLRLTDRLPYFVSGVGIPDCVVVGADMLAVGAAGIRAAGFFGLDWSVENGDFAWAKPTGE